MSEDHAEKRQLSRRGFLQTSAVATAGVATVAAPTAAVMGLQRRPGGAVASHPAAVVTDPSGPAPPEPVMAYLRDAATGEVTVMSGTTETTYRDPVLTQRLLDAAGPSSTGGGI